MTTPQTIAQHQAVVNTFAAEMNALPPESVRDPAIPMPTFLDEASNLVAAADEHGEPLRAVGMPPTLPGILAARAAGTQSAQVLWNAESRKGRTQETEAALERAF